MSAKKIIVAAVSNALVLLTTATGCNRKDEDPLAAATKSSDSLLGNRMQAAGGTVTCSGDQDNGGRICCDATHCCINIKGTINCNLPAPKKQAR